MRILYKNEEGNLIVLDGVSKITVERYDGETYIHMEGNDPDVIIENFQVESSYSLETVEEVVRDSLEQMAVSGRFVAREVVDLTLLGVRTE